MNEVKLTALVKSSGCAAKLPPCQLREVLDSLPKMHSDKLVKGFEGNEDALVYDLGDGKAMVQTVDFFPPMVDDPLVFGHIAAANALSDVYAMGCVPAVALNLLCMPAFLDMSVMHDILLGGIEKVEEAGGVIAGGHTISDPTVKYGLCVTGFGQIDKIWKNTGAKVGDVLVLTKKIGTGIQTTAMKAEMGNSNGFSQAVKSMETLNKIACENAKDLEIHAATDVTGFSLLGHSLEMAGDSDVALKINSADVPLFEGTYDLAGLGLLPAGMYANLDYIGDKVLFHDGVSQTMRDILLDPQTSGGLLFAMPASDATIYTQRMKNSAYLIGNCFDRVKHSIEVF